MYYFHSTEIPSHDGLDFDAPLLPLSLNFRDHFGYSVALQMWFEGKMVMDILAGYITIHSSKNIYGIKNSQLKLIPFIFIFETKECVFPFCRGNVDEHQPERGQFPSLGF